MTEEIFQGQVIRNPSTHHAVYIVHEVCQSGAYRLHTGWEVSSQLTGKVQTLENLCAILEKDSQMRCVGERIGGGITPGSTIHTVRVFAEGAQGLWLCEVP